MNLSIGSYTPKLQIGGKFNFTSSVVTQPTENTIFGASARTHAVVTPASTTFGGQASIWGQHQLVDSNTVIFGQANARVENEKLHLGSFNETVENNLVLGVNAGVRLNSGTQVTVGYNQKLDKLNNTRSYNMFNLSISHNF